MSTTTQLVKKLYRGWKIEKFEGIQTDYRTDGGRRGKGRKVSGRLVSHPEHCPNGKFCDTELEAREYVDEFMGGGDVTY